MQTIKKIVLIFSGLVMAITNTNATETQDGRFDKFKEQFVLDMWKVYPVWASSVGFHKYDGVLIVPDDASRKNEIDFCNSELKLLSSFKPEKLSPANRTDYALIQNQLNYSIWSVNELKSWQWDPSSYNVSGVIADMLGNEYAPVEQRLRDIDSRLKSIPAYYASATKNVVNPTREHTDLAIEQNSGGISVFEKDLPETLGKSKLSETDKKQILEDAAKCVTAINEYVRFLKNAEGREYRDFRLGAALYEKKFEFEMQSGYKANEIYLKAQKHKEELHHKMYEITDHLWTKYFNNKPLPPTEQEAIRMMIGRLSEKHVPAREFQAAIEKQIPLLTDFIKAKDLLYIDPSKPLVVRREPAYMAGVAGASINAPGPYDKNGNTYYNVGSLDGWDKKKAESYLREYNHYILQILNIHEAIPGHYTQLVYANRSPSIIKSILGNNAMIEGWAVYTERMMLENGYDADKGLGSVEASPEMWLMYYKWNLRSTCNTILDYGVHVLNMPKIEAMNLLTKDAFQETTEAEGKWRRVSVTQVQLCCYFTGYTEIYDLREDMKSAKGTSFNLRKFHEQFLSYGSAPVKYIRGAMLNTNVK